ncbi:MAG: co-chaperone GroES [Patescibacteria group bacterium]|nr:co-chaperone GroES [Patescibacteria group bacterium]
MNFKPLSDNLLVKPLEQEEITKSGIVLPDTVKEKPEKGQVVAAGPGKMENGKNQPMSVKVGDMVMFKKYSPDEIKVGDKKMLIISESDILGIIE